MKVNNKVFVVFVSLILLIFIGSGLYLLNASKSPSPIHITNTATPTPLPSATQTPAADTNIACGGPRAVEQNEGCPAGYHCGNMQTIGGETSGRCIKN
jgi:hypothetical protein